jgi:glycosyltransferase involved in cell wall biosynthesis
MSERPNAAGLAARPLVDRPALKVAFLRMAPHPIPNRLLPPHLEEAFPGSRVDVFDVGAAVRRDPLSMLVNPLFLLIEHGVNILTRRVSARRAFFTTSWMFRRMSRAARSFVEEGDYAFSFQIQSLFDGRSGDRAHVVYTDHTHLTNLDYEDFDRRTLRCQRWLALERKLYEGATLLLTRSQNVSRTLIERYASPPERVVCVGAGSNARLPDPSQRPAQQGGPLILFVGVDWERKGGPQLIEAFRRVRSEHPDARLRIVGASPSIDCPGVEVLGRCPVDEVHTHYEAASIFCLPSRREPFGVAYLEALHHGLPVVGTRIGAVPELVEEGVDGFLVQVGDTDALAASLSKLVADPELRRSMGERARRRARESWTWEAVAKRMASSIRSALGDSATVVAAARQYRPECAGARTPQTPQERRAHLGAEMKTEGVTL